MRPSIRAKRIRAAHAKRRRRHPVRTFGATPRRRREDEKA